MVDGRYGKAISVIGTDGYVDFGDIPGWQGLQQYTMSAWVYMANPLSGWQLVLGKANYWGVGDTAFHCVSWNCGAYIAGGQARSEVYYAAHSGNWHHWSMTYDHGQVKFYLDGQQQASRNYNDTPGNLSLRFGSPQGRYYRANAMIDDIMIHNRVLSDTEIEGIAQSETSVLSGSSNNGSVCAADSQADIGYLYAPDNQRLQSINTIGAPLIEYQYDEVGNTIQAADHSYEYNNANRLSQAMVNGLTTDYRYNALGQRTLKTNANESVLFIYDLNGQLIGEYDSSSSTIMEYVYLNGKTLALLNNQNEIYFVHNDHLGTPQHMSNLASNIVWKAEYTPFGEAEIDEDVDGDGRLVKNNQRFLGQYYDWETELNYNYFRYYESATGRYITSDPIGLAGGINTYAYALQNSINNIDPYGLSSIMSNIYDFENPDNRGIDDTPAWYRRKKMGQRVEKEFNKCKEAGECILVCGAGVVAGEIATQMVEKGSMTIVGRVRSSLWTNAAKKLIPVAGQVSTAYSAYQALQCIEVCTD